MQGELEHSGLLIDIDSLFDTRLSVLNAIDKTLLDKNVREAYFKRTRDRFLGISPEDFKRRYKARTAADIKESSVSSIVNFVSQFAKATIDNIMKSPFHMKPVVILNTYPYNLTDMEVKQFMACLRHVTDNLADITVIHKSPEELTVRYVKDYLSVVIMYHYDEWIKVQSELGNFDKLRCPEITLIAPRLIFNEEIKGDVDDPEEVFKLTEELISPLIGLQLFDVRDFCALC